MHRTMTLGVGGIGAAVLGTLCCLGAPLFLALGIGTGFIAAIAPLRPLFGALMLVFLGAGFYVIYIRSGSAGRKVESGSGLRMARSRDRLVFWIAAIVAIALWALPIVFEMTSGAATHR